MVMTFAVIHAMLLSQYRKKGQRNLCLNEMKSNSEVVQLLVHILIDYAFWNNWLSMRSEEWTFVREPLSDKKDNAIS